MLLRLLHFSSLLRDRVEYSIVVPDIISRARIEMNLSSYKSSYVDINILIVAFQFNEHLFHYLKTCLCIGEREN